MFEEELTPKKAQRHELGASLESWSVADLQELLALLDTEKARVTAELTRKQGAIGGAEALFKR